MVELHLGTLAVLVAAGFAAGAVNAVAGGGSLISFPVLVAVGYPAVTANVTNAVAVLPGYLGGSVAYRQELAGQRGRSVALGVTSAVGAVAGAFLLTVSSEATFSHIVPFLVLGSCALLAAQPALSRRWGAREAEAVADRAPGDGRRSPRLHAATLAAAVYGGYFGAGLGILLLAVLALGLADSLHRLNALKGLLSLVVGVAAAAYFAFFGPVQWGAAAAMAISSFAGGQAGVALARRLAPGPLRAVVVLLGVVAGSWLLLRW